MPDEFDVFLSHNSRDKPAVEEVAARLRDRGLRVWLDKDELRPGLPWQEGLEEGVRASRSVAVFVGKDGMGAWQTPEMRAFLARSRREGIPVIPVLLPGCPESPQLDLFLEAMTWVDLRQGLTDEGLARLAWGITGTKSGGAGAVPAAAPGTAGRPGRSSRPKTPRSWWSWGVALALLGVLLALAAWRWLRSPDLPPPPPKPEIYAVHVQVLDPQGHRVKEATVHASVGYDPLWRPQDDSWEIRIPRANVPTSGWITVSAKHPDWEESQEKVRLGTEEIVPVEIRLKKPESWIRGKVVDESGGRLANVPVSVQEGPPGDAITGPKGRFELKLPVPPETQVRVRAEYEGMVGENFCFAGRDTCSIVLEKP